MPIHSIGKSFMEKGGMMSLAEEVRDSLEEHEKKMEITRRNREIREEMSKIERELSRLEQENEDVVRHLKDFREDVDFLQSRELVQQDLSKL